MSKEMIDRMVDSFLGWKLPEDFSPDGGISFRSATKLAYDEPGRWPVGTNLLTADQAKAMFTHVLSEALDGQEILAGEVTSSPMNSHLSLLGLKAEDKVTGLNGVVTSIAFDLYGCIQALVNPGRDKEGKLQEQHWFDINRLGILDDAPVLPRPDFDIGPQAEGKQGPAEKPRFMKP